MHSPSRSRSGFASAEQGGGGEQAAASGEQTRLTKRVRKLYEETAVPVREIASLAGVTERTVYKYAAKHDWRPRYRWRPDGARPRGWRAGQRFAPAKGAGGRFIRREDKGKPFAAGLKATDAQAERRAAKLAQEADALARAAREKAQAHARFEARMRAADGVNRALDELNRYREARAKQRPGQKWAVDDRLERAHLLAVNLAADRLQALQAIDSRAP